MTDSTAGAVNNQKKQNNKEKHLKLTTICTGHAVVIKTHRDCGHRVTEGYAGLCACEYCDCVMVDNDKNVKTEFVGTVNPMLFA